LTPKQAARTLAGSFLAGHLLTSGRHLNRQQVKANETHLPAQQSQAGTYPRLPRAHGNESRAPGPEASSGQGPRAAYAVTISLQSNSVTRDSNSKAPPATRFPFGRAERLPDKAAFAQVFGNARRSRDRCFTILYCRNDRDEPRLGLAIAKKNCRLAVERNRLKRIIRESFRTHRTALGGLDFVVMNKPGAESMSNRELFDSLAAHWQRCRSAANRGQEKG